MKYILLSCILIVSHQLGAQIVWEQNYGGSSIDELVELTGGQNNELLLIGSTLSNDGDINNYLGQKDALLINTNFEGIINWSINIGGTANDEFRSAVQTMDGDWYVVGKSISTDLDISNGNGSDQGLLCHLSQDGVLQWCKTYGEIEDDEFFTISLTPSGNLLLSGAVDNEDLFTESTVRHSNQDFWLLELSPDGSVIWEKKYGGSDSEQALDHLQDDEGNIYISGFAVSNDMDLDINYGLKDIWILKTDDQGNILWKKSYGGSSFEEGRKLALRDDILYLAGGSFSNDNTFEDQQIGQEDGFILALSAETGNLLKQTNTGGVSADRINDLLIKDDEIIITGFSKSALNGTQGYGGTDYWARSFDFDLSPKWTRIFGGSNEDVAHSILHYNNSMFVGGSSYSNDQDISEPYGLSDIWVLNYDLISRTQNLPKAAIDYLLFEDHILIHSLPNGPYTYMIYDLLGRPLHVGDFQVNNEDIRIELSESSFFLLNIVHAKQSNLNYSIKGIQN